MSEGPITPDFYSYEWQPIQQVVLAHHFVTVMWADGVTLDCYALWLAENTDGLGLESKTREAMIDPADLPAAADLVEATVGVQGELRLGWADGRSSAAHPGWLRHVAEGNHTPRALLPELMPWTSETFSQPPTVDGTHVLEDETILTQWMNLLCRYGLARLTNVPASESWLEQLAKRIGPVRGSNFGNMWSVRYVEDPNTTAYTSLNLGQHSDLPTRETPPGFQFLHCVENTVEGGWSRMTDGLSVVATLEAQYPEAYEALTTLQWVFFNRDVGEDHRWSGPIIDHGAPGQPLTLRAFYPVRAFPNMAKADIPRAYEAMRIFSQVAHSDVLQLRYPFTPGDLVAFDNRRVLHGRDAFDPGGGQRWLQGCYIDQDDVFSRLRVLHRTAENLQRQQPKETSS